MTVKRPTPRVPRTPQEQARRTNLLDAASGALGDLAPVSLPGDFSLPSVEPCCDCGDKLAPHRGEWQEAHPAPGVVRAGWTYRCTSCHLAHLREVAA